MIPAFFFGIVGFDPAIHGLWTESFYNLLKSGELRPTHTTDMYAGYGSYIFLFYPPLSFYINSIFFPFFADPEKINFLVLVASALFATIFSGITCYIWLKDNFSNKVSLACAVLYIVIPSHSVSFYFSASPSQYWCFVFFPLVMMGIERIASNRNNGIILYALGQTLITLTSIPTLIIFSPFAFLYGLCLAPKFRTFFKLIISAVISFSLAGFYLLPMYFLKNYVNIEGHWSGKGGLDYRDFFLFFGKNRFVIK